MKLTIEGDEKSGFGWQIFRKGHCVAKAGRTYKTAELARAAFRRLHIGSHAASSRRRVE